MIELLIAFLKIGCVSVGGGYAMLPILYQTVAEYGIMTQSAFSDLVAISQITPGPVSVNTATYAGFAAHGWVGSFLMSVAVCLPGALFTYFAVTALKKKENTIGLTLVLKKMKVAGTALVGVSGLFLAEGSIFSGPVFSSPIPDWIDPVQLALFLLTLCLYWKTKLGPVLLTLMMGGLSIGIALCRTFIPLFSVL